MMLPFEDRYSAQRRLVEVGPEGQRRLEQSRMVLVEHSDLDIEREYLARAGISDMLIDVQASPPVFPWVEQFEFASPLAVARGAWCALARLRSVLALDKR